LFCEGRATYFPKSGEAPDGRKNGKGIRGSLTRDRPDFTNVRKKRKRKTEGRPYKLLKRKEAEVQRLQNKGNCEKKGKMKTSNLAGSTC